MTWPLDLQSAFRAMELLSGLGVALSSLEFLALRREFLVDGLYYGSGNPIKFFIPLCLLRFVLALWFALVMLPGYWGTLRLAFLVGATVLSNYLLIVGLEAADQMLSILLVAQLFASLAPGNTSVEKACLWFVALQATLAYAVAGWAKWMKPNWRDGSYLHSLLNSEMFGHALAAKLVSNSWRAQWLSRALIGAESLFPLALITGPYGSLAFCIVMLTMHLLNSWFLGLNLFVWAFLATYPAILYCAFSLWR